MARIPISFYVSIFAGFVVIFNHFASSETGDVALNKVTGAAGRFYALFRDTALTFHHGCITRLKTAVCGPTTDSFLPQDAAEYIRVHFCRADADDGGDGGQTSGKSSGGYGSSDGVVLMYHRPSIRPLGAEKRLGEPLRLDFGVDSLFRTTWDGCREATATIGLLLVRTWASYWWFKAPFWVLGAALAAYAILSVLGYVSGASVVLQVVFRAVLVDFLRCIQWEAQRRALSIGSVMMERAYSVVTRGGDNRRNVLGRR